MRRSSTHQGFTIVELLIVIVVIGILAAITIVAYNGVQERARNSQRVSDMSTIVKALELYRIEHGTYPDETPTIAGGWESSAVDPDGFIAPLKTSGILAKVPVDPINTAANGALSSRPDTISYIYHYYPAGHMGCDTARGPFYVLAVAVIGTPLDSSPGFACGTYNSSGFGIWSTGKFLN